MRRRMRRRAPIALLLLLGLALLVAACGGGDDDSRGDGSGSDDTGGDGGSETSDREGERRPDSEVFSWVSSDGVTIAAEFRRGGEDWVLMGHQFTGSRGDWDQMVDGFAARGYSVLTWDFRCHGESGCNTENDSKRDATVDIWREWVAALDYANDNGARVIHAGGASMGGTSLIQVAADRDDIASIFAISSPNRFQGLDALANYDRVTVPKLFIVGAGDMAAPDFSQRYFDLATGPARLEILETALHGNTLAMDPEWGPIVQPMLYRFAEDPDGYVAAGDVNNLTAAAAADDEGAPSAGEQAAAETDAQSADAQPTDTQSADAQPADEQSADAGAATDAESLRVSASGYVIALRAPGPDGDRVVVVDPFNVEDFQIVQDFEGPVMDVVWTPLSPTLVVGQADQIVLLDLSLAPPEAIAIPTSRFLPDGIAADFFGMALSADGTVLSFGVVPADIGQAPSTPAVVNLLGPVALAPYAGELSDTPSQAGVISPTDDQLLSREVNGLVVLDAATLAVVERIPAPVIDDAREVCNGDLCTPVSYNTIFPDEYGWVEVSNPGIIWAQYSNKLFLRVPGETELREWLNLPGLATDVAVSPDGTGIAWVSAGPPDGTNALLLTDLEMSATRVLAQDDDRIFFDLEWSSDSRFVAFTVVDRTDRTSVGVLIADPESGEITPVGPGCCATWRPVIQPRP